MSAADRDYWKKPEPSSERLLPDWPLSYWLMGALVVCYALQAINSVHGYPAYELNLALTTVGIRNFWAWQLLTFQFLHGSLLHLLFNLLALYFFGRTVERILGKWRFALAYFGAGVVGGLLQAALMIAFPTHYSPVVLGASAGISGIFAIFCLLHPDAVINLFMVLPVPARVAFYIGSGIEIFFTLVPSPQEAGIAHPAHLGGIVFGALWVRQGWHHEWISFPGAQLADRLKTIFYRPRRSPPLTVIKGGAGSRVRTATPTTVAKVDEPNPADLPPAEFIAREVDPILDKIAAHGMASLTEREHRILAAAREKMAKR